MKSVLHSKRRGRRAERTQRRISQKPKPTLKKYRENPEHFARRMRVLRNKTAVQLFRTADENQQKLIAEKLIQPWAWYASPEEFFSVQTKGDPFWAMWKRFVDLQQTTHHDPRKRMELKQLRKILRQFTNPQIGFVGEMQQNGKTTIVVIVGRDMTAMMITRRLKEYLLFDPLKGWKKLEASKPKK